MKHTIAVIGAHGRMGALFCSEWSKKHTVRAIDRVRDNVGALVLREEDLFTAVPDCGVVLLCVPAPAVREVMGLLAPHMHGGQILADVCSVKSNPMRTMQERFAGPVIGAHPLFGPANNRSGARVALVRGDAATEAHYEIVAGLFREMGCVTFAASAEEHDRAVAVSQSLHFALSAAYFAMVNRHDNLEPYLTPSFKRYMNAARKELTSNAGMFCEFTADNPMFPETLTKVCEALEGAGNGDISSLAQEAGEWYAKENAEE